MKVIIVEPNKVPYVKEINNNLEDFQEVVGGYIETVFLPNGLILVCNEEGKIKGLPVNRKIGNDIIVGTFIVTTNKGDEFVSLNDDQIKEALAMLAPESTDFSNDERIQELARRIFPQMDIYPMNSMTPSIANDENGKAVSFFVLADDEMIQDFRQHKGISNIEISTYLEKNENGIGKDLVIKLDFFFPTGHPIFETVVYGDLLDKQTDFVKALREVNKIALWIANKDRVVEKVMYLSWSYDDHKKTLDKLI